ncbi:hypothetical protein PFISCL1PPCAC_12566, partial [Pristionchus fissidentatus]
NGTTVLIMKNFKGYYNMPRREMQYIKINGTHTASGMQIHKTFFRRVNDADKIDFTTFHDALDIIVKSTFYEDSQGLEFDLTVQFNDCGGSITEGRGRLILPRYIPNDVCKWIIV